MRAMIFEDDFLLAATLADALIRLGYEVDTRVSSFDAALEAATHADADLVVVDLDLRGVMAYPALDRLEERGIPFVFATCTAVEDLPERFMSVPTVSKPYDTAELRQAIAAIGRHRR
ncbi:MAG: response regulator [Rhodanobacter sp.]